MDTMNQVLGILGVLIPLLTATGMLNKYLPALRNVSNKVTPWLNAIIAFFALFGAEIANAGLFGDVGKALSFPAKIAVSLLAAYIQSRLYDKFGAPILPPGPISDKQRALLATQ